jgi:beta-lactamase class A
MSRLAKFAISCPAVQPRFDEEEHVPERTHDQTKVCQAPATTTMAGLMRRRMRRLIVALLLLTSVSALAAAPAAGDKQQVLWERLRVSISSTEQQLDGVLGIAILDLTTGQQLLVHPDEVFPQASSIKIAVLAELYHQAEQSAAGVTGKAKLTDRYVVQTSDLVPDSSIMGGLTSGVTALTNRDLATIMVAVSDNSATNVLIDRVGMDNVASLMQHFGLPHTQLRRKMMDLKAAAEGRENVSTPREMMQLLEQLYRGKVIGQPFLEDFFTVLATPKESWLPRDLPEGLRIANKPGELEGVRNDSGIVFLKNRPYVICVMTTFLASERAGEDAITHISAAAYSVFDRLGRASDLGRVISPSNGSQR